MSDLKIDIIIVVKNGGHKLRVTISKLQKFYNKKNFTLTIVDDGSADKSTLEYYELLKKDNSIEKVILRNFKSIGFIKSINKAIRRSSANDVIILNSDSFINSSLIGNLHYLSYYSGDAVGIITIYNNYPGKQTIYSDKMGEIKKKGSLPIYRFVENGEQFVMYLKRKTINLGVGFSKFEYEPGIFEEIENIVKQIFINTIKTPYFFLIAVIIGFAISYLYGFIPGLYSAIFLIWLLLSYDSRILAIAALVFLLIIPYLLVTKQTDLAEIFAQNVYILLVYTVVFQIIEYIKFPHKQTVEITDESSAD